MTTFPDLGDYAIAIDIETKEEKDIKKYGPGSHRHYLEGEDSYILGVAISDSTSDYYFPASKELFDWLREIQQQHLWIGHKILYDYSWLNYEGFWPLKSADTMTLVRLLDEDRLQGYSLDSCATDFLGAQKNEWEITQFCKDHGLRGKPQKWLWKMPFEMVAKYAKIDTRLTYKLYQKLIHHIERQNLEKVWEVETELIPILAENHHRGIRIDDSRRQEASESLQAEIQSLKTWMIAKAKKDFNPNSGKQLKPIFDDLGLTYKTNPPTEKMLKKNPKAKGNPSFKGEDLLPYGVEPNMKYFPHVLIIHNKLHKLQRDFVDRLEDFMVCGRIHPMVNPAGTKTGRPSASTPNIFQIPKRGRGKEICRVLFLPEEGEEWVSMDYASEEFRVFAHYAVGKGSDRYREKYNTEDDFDMHLENAEIAGLGKDGRPKAKTIGLGVMFGMGAPKMAMNLGEGEEKGRRILKKFHKHNPSFKETSDLVKNVAEQRGYIHTILGRRRRLNRKTSYKGLNFLTQANSADLAKLTIVEANRRGLLDKLNFLLFLYDEYDLSCKPENRKYVEEFKELGETAIKFKVKMVLDVEYGENWACL